MAEEEKQEQETQQEEEKTEETPAEETQEETSTEEAQEETASSDEAQAEEAADASSDDAADDGEDVEVPEKFQSLVEQIETMSVLDLNELVKLLEKKFGVSAVAVAAGGGGAAEGGGEAEEKDSFTVHLASAGDNKIQVIKAVKGALGLGLKEAKELVEGAPADLKADMPKEEAEELKGQVEEAGGTIELK